MTGRSLLTAGVCLFLALPLHGQVSPDDHAKHHPKEKAGMDAAGGHPSGKMEGMGGDPAKELFPSLMDFPDLSREKRAEIERQAHGRMIAGLSLMSEALDRLAQATERNDYPAMQEATARMREGFAQYESGLAAQRALAEGKSPSRTALQWFKREMNLDASDESSPSTSPIGLSWFHFFVMIILVGFASAMLWMYFHKMRRARELLQQLTAKSPAVPTESPRTPSSPIPPPPSGSG